MHKLEYALFELSLKFEKNNLKGSSIIRDLANIPHNYLPPKENCVDLGKLLLESIKSLDLLNKVKDRYEIKN